MERKIKKYVRCANGIGRISKGEIHRNMSCGRNMFVLRTHEIGRDAEEDIHRNLLAYAREIHGNLFAYAHEINRNSLSLN